MNRRALLLTPLVVAVAPLAPADLDWRRPVQSRAQVPGAVNNWSVSCSQQSNFSAQILDSVNHTSLSLETRQSDTVLTVSEGRAA